jgi:adenylate kinase family enzyme
MQNGPRIVVVGTSGSGKTTLARLLAERLHLPHIELDALNWGPEWRQAPTEQFRAAVAEAISADGWVLDGNYSRVRDLVRARATTLIWLDYPLPVIYWQLTRRTLQRVIGRVELWNGNKETWRAVFSRDSLYLWVWKTYKRRRTEYPALLQQPEYAHLHVVRLRSPRALRRWLESAELLPPDKPGSRQSRP